MKILFFAMNIISNEYKLGRISAYSPVGKMIIRMLPKRGDKTGRTPFAAAVLFPVTRILIALRCEWMSQAQRTHVASAKRSSGAATS